MDDSNVIQFPKERMKKSEPTSNVSFELERKKVMTSASLASILILASILNFKFVNQNSQAVNNINERSLASVVVDRETSPAWEKKLLKRLKRFNLISDKEMGRLPTSIEKLRYEQLNSNYIVRVDKNTNKVTSVSFVKGIDRPAKSTYVKSRAEFLTKNKEALPNFDRVILIPPKIGVSESYQLVYKDNSIGTVDFRLDQHGNLMKMKVNTFSKH